MQNTAGRNRQMLAENSIEIEIQTVVCKVSKKRDISIWKEKVSFLLTIMNRQ